MRSKEEILKSIIYKHGEGENYSNVIFAMQEYADQSTQALREENEKLDAKIKELRGIEYALGEKLTSKDKEIEELRIDRSNIIKDKNQTIVDLMEENKKIAFQLGEKNFTIGMHELKMLRLENELETNKNK